MGLPANTFFLDADPPKILKKPYFPLIDPIWVFPVKRDILEQFLRLGLQAGV
jgi:hypothetical protein